MSGDFFETLGLYTARIRARNPMAMYRFADGEIMLSHGHAVGEATQANRVDGWQAPNKLTRLGHDLNMVLDTQEACFHFGIPCTCCDPPGNAELKARITRSPVFPVNLWINANYPHFVNFLREQLDGIPVSVVMSERGDEWKLPFRINRRLSVPADCVNYYEKDKYSIVSAARQFAQTARFELIFVGAGPLSEALIFYMWNANPYNTYVDVGSALDEFIFGKKTRSYMTPGTEYAQRQCVL